MFRDIHEEKNIIYISCNFNDVNFSNYNLEESYFDKSCKFINSEYNNDIEQKLSCVGKNVLEQIRIIENCEKLGVRKLVSNFNEHYSGYSNLIKSFMIFSKKENNYPDALLFEYYWNLYSDKSKIKKIFIKSTFKYLLGRYIIGYGYHYWKPLITYILINITFSFLFLFNGIMFRGEIINRTLIFSISKFSETISDWFKCFYFSSITSLTIGYGDSYPIGFISSMLSISLGFIEMVLFTIFVVIFARRYFR